MQRVSATLLFWTLILSACSTGIATPRPLPPSTTETPAALPTTAIPDPKLIATLSTPHIDQPPDGEIATLPSIPQDCGYQWAYEDLPELSSSFQGAIRALQPEATASAYAFGENCILSDGSVAGFIPMETDFNISLQVDDLANEAVLGRWILQVMQVIESIPADQIAGPRPGRVSIVFQSSTAQSVINFYINQYRELPEGLNHTQIYEALQSLQ